MAIDVVLPRATGYSGWTAVTANVADGARVVQQVVDWVGGTGDKPATGEYIGPSGYVSDIALATNIRGADGSSTGDVTGPSSSTDSALVLFDGSTGKLIKNGPPSAGLASLAGLSTPAIYYLSAADTWTPVTIGANLTFTAGTLSASGGGGGGGSGDVTGPSSATDGAPAVFDGATGKAIKEGAYPVTSVAGKTGAVTLAKGDVGLGNVDNTSDAAKPVSTATQTALDAKANITDTIVSVTTARALADSDSGKVLEVNSASAVTLTAPSTLSAGFNCIVSQVGAGQVTVAAGSGATVNAHGGAKTAGQWAEMAVRVRGSAGAVVVSGGVA